MNSTDTKPKSKAEREAEEKARRRAEAATIVAGLKQAIAADEQLLGFARGRVAGGIRGKMSLGPEAFFAPFVNIGLTERRLVIQHVNAETGRPGEILPHFYALGDIAALTFSDIETFGGESAARLTVRLHNDQRTRLRLRGQSNLESAQAIVEVFRSLTLAQRPTTTPTQRVCATCQHVLDQPFKFCPYCGQLQDLNAPPVATPTATAEPERSYPPTPPGPTEPEFLDAVPYQDASIFRGPTVEDGLDFLTPESAPQPTTVLPEPEPDVTPEPELPATPEPEAFTAPEPEDVAEPGLGAVTTAPPAEDTAFETPSAFEGWSVDPGATSSVVEPIAEDEQAPPPQGFTPEASFSTGPAFDTEASIAETTLEESISSAVPVDPPQDQTEVYVLVETEAPTVHPEAEFTPIPEPVAFTPEEAPTALTFETFPVESGTAPQSDPEPEASPKPSVASAPDFVWTALTGKALHKVEPVPATEESAMAPAEFDAPPATESFSEVSLSPIEPGEPVAPEPVAAAPTHEGAGFVTEPVAVEAPTPAAQGFEPFAPVIPPAVPESVPAPEIPAMPEMAELTGAAASLADPAPVAAPEPEPFLTPAAEPAPVVTSSSEDRFAALLREVRGGDTPVQTAPVFPPTIERRDGPMSVNVHINRPPIVINEIFAGRNADEVVGKLKARVSSELNFAMRMMVNSYNNLRFAQELVRRYNDKEKTNYPVPNSCWEFLLSAEDINFVTISLDK